jgi:hypothetical protein
VTFRPDTWRAALEADRPHLLFVESAWKGNGGSWEFQVGSYSYPQSVGLPHLSELVEWCRAHDVPTVFWNKEDPVHFDKFKEAARLFDVVLTTDADRIPHYEALDGLRAEVVAALPFAAQPTLHHPTHELPTATRGRCSAAPTTRTATPSAASRWSGSSTPPARST